MEKKTYKTPCMKVREISPTVLLSTSDGLSIRMFNESETEGLEDEISQW